MNDKEKTIVSHRIIAVLSSLSTFVFVYFFMISEDFISVRNNLLFVVLLLFFSVIVFGFIIGYFADKHHNKEPKQPKGEL